VKSTARFLSATSPVVTALQPLVDSPSHFTITARLGAGGKGEIYGAQDSRLGRERAIEVLPSPFV
jgi:hypothetical protein